MMKQYTFAIAILVLVSAVASADTAEQRIVTRMQTMFPDEQVTDIAKSPLSGIYEVLIGGSVFYISEDGRYVLQGDLIDLDQRRNLSSRKREVARKEAFENLAPADFVEFAAAAGKPAKVLYVFTDVDCGYCRKMHSEMAALNAGGITVRYLAFPRSGLEGESFTKAAAVWCADNRQEAMTLSKLGKLVSSRQCDNPVAREFELGHSIGVTGTPAVYTQAGRQLGGYVPAEELVRMLKEGKI